MSIFSALHPTFIYANYAEACLWAALGVAALLKLKRAAGVVLGMALLAFAASDVVEAQTGTWYRPWWLLVWKVACLVLITASGAKLLWSGLR